MDAPFSYLAAFATGVASFLAPCTLALVPLYLSYLGGFTLAGQVDGAQSRNQVAMAVNILLFSLGFTVVFVALGASLGTLSAAVVTFSPWLNQVSGVFIILMGLITLGLIQTPTFIPWFKPQQATGVRFRWLASFLVGATFALGWTPCVGPILGAILAVAGTSTSAGYGAALLASFSFGLMVPFVAAGLVTGWTSQLLRTQGRWLEVAHQAAGVMLIAFGISLFTGLLPRISSALALGT